jgi:hypothetical protein
MTTITLDSVQPFSPVGQRIQRMLVVIVPAMVRARDPVAAKRFKLDMWHAQLLQRGGQLSGGIEQA